MSTRHVRAAGSFPPWTPDSIVSICEAARAALASVYNGQPGEDTIMEFETEADVCERLAGDPEMRSVWKALHHKRRKWQQGPKGHDGKLVREIVREKLEAPHRSRRTNAERRDLLLEIANKAHELRNLVKKAAAERMGHWSAIDEGVQSDFFDALDRLIDEATVRVGQPEQRTKRTPNYAALDMAKRIGRFVESALDEPLYEHVATITNVVCGSALTRDNVKSALRSGGGRGGAEGQQSEAVEPTDRR